LSGYFPADLALLALLITFLGVLVVYSLFARRRWVTLSPKGIQGHTLFPRGRQPVQWHEQVVVTTESLPKGPLGIAIYRLAASGRPKLRYAVFIPDQILRTQDFLDSLNVFAPPDHPVHLWLWTRGRH